MDETEIGTGNGNRSNAYASLVGSLMYLAVATRPDIAFAVNKLASYTANPELKHWSAIEKENPLPKGYSTAIPMRVLRVKMTENPSPGTYL